MIDLTALAARVEREASSRDLDAEIARAIGWKQNVDYSDRWVIPDGRVFAPLPAFTESVDAAVELRPDGFRWSVDSDGHAEVWDCSGRFLVKEDIERHGRASTPAAALAAASLRARAAMMEKADG